MIAYTDGLKDKSRYRKFKLRSVDPSDDYGAMLEVLSRRYKRAKDENDLPDLIVIDGGKGHLNMALRVLQELNIVSVDVIGVAKEEGIHSKGMTLEQLSPQYQRSGFPFAYIVSTSFPATDQG